MRRLATPVLVLTLALGPLLAACQNDAHRYSTGGEPGDDPCARVVSAIGYAAPLLSPRGQEDDQNFEDALLGRLAEEQGILLEYGARLPEELQEAVASAKRTTQALMKADTPRERQVALLKEYRAAADRIVAGCPKP